ncbi:MAG: rhodanese-related sulfurtransferase [Pseudomonadota bacterium]
MSRYLVAALYKFVPLPDYAELRSGWQAEGERLNICGSLLIAREGINGTIAGEETALRSFLSFLRADPRLDDLDHKESWTAEPPFLRFRVRLKREIVSMGAPDVVRPDTVGTYVEPEDWNALIQRPDMVVIDTRNDYEVAIGAFEGAVDPGTRSFTEFPDWVKNASALANKPPVAMYCTGGIRCEKSTAYLRSLGFEEVYHLKGGILKYLETVPEGESLWQGECFVFDARVSVGHGLREGNLALCYGCRRPLTERDKASPLFEPGICCPACAPDLTADRRARLEERHRQVTLAEARGEAHIGRKFSTV